MSVARWINVSVSNTGHNVKTSVLKSCNRCSAYARGGKVGEKFLLWQKLPPPVSLIESGIESLQAGGTVKSPGLLRMISCRTIVKSIPKMDFRTSDSRELRCHADSSKMANLCGCRWACKFATSVFAFLSFFSRSCTSLRINVRFWMNCLLCWS